MVQSNSIGSTCQTAFGIPSWVVGLVLVVICGFIFLGGIKRLAAVTEKLVPIMAALFLAVSYTHLDVYKRQPFHLFGIGIEVKGIS